MPLVNAQALARTVLDAERDVNELGWDQPSLLLAVHGPPAAPSLEYMLQFGGRAAQWLRDLLKIGMQADGGIGGLILIVNAGRGCMPVPAAPTKNLVWVGPTRRGRAVMAVLRDGQTAVAVHDEGEDAHMLGRLPEVAGDHDEVAKLAMMLLGPALPSPRSVSML